MKASQVSLHPISRASCLALSIVLGAAPLASVQAAPPVATYADALADAPRRQNDQIARLVRHFHHKRAHRLPEWDKGKCHKEARWAAQEAIATIGAVLYVLAHPGDFPLEYGLLSNPLYGAPSCGSLPTTQHWQCTFMAYLDDAAAEGWLDSVGTAKDFDMVLMGVINLIYAFQHEPIMTNAMIKRLLCLDDGYCKNKGRPRLTFGHDDHFLVVKAQTWVWHGETENHILNIYTYNYLATQWVMWQGGIHNSSHPRFDPTGFVQNARNKYGSKYLWNANAFYDLPLMILGRVVHNGLFETNSKPYEGHSLLALLTLANYADSAEPHLGDDAAPGKVKQAALNAMNFLTARYSYQSLRGKRSAPIRRQPEQRKHLGLYDKNSAPYIWAILSGAQEFDDCIDDLPSCSQYNHDTSGTRHKVIWTALGAKTAAAYQIHPVIHRFIFQRRRPYYARLMSRFSKDHYTPMSLGHKDNSLKPLYFDNKIKASMGGSFEGTLELYFGSDHFMLAAGGKADKYWPASWGDKTLGEYHIYSRPTLLFTRGYFGDDWEQSVGTARRDALAMRGKKHSWWQAECNIWLYKNFYYAYEVDDDPLGVATNHHNGWPQLPPEHWADHLGATLTINGSQFRIYQFDSGAEMHPAGTGKGMFVVMARLRKDASKWPHNPRHYRYRRGFVELVPRHLFDSAKQVADWIYYLNVLSAGGQFDRGSGGTAFKYVLASSTKSNVERVTLYAKMGSNKIGGEACNKGIERIERMHNGSWVELNLEDYLLPRDVSDDNLRKVPALTVWELGKDFEHTGRMFATTVQEGRYRINYPRMVGRQEVVDTLEINSWDYTDPKQCELLYPNGMVCSP